MNIEQKNLPALLKAADTLQIRGLSGGDIFAKESYKRLAELEQDEAVESMIVQEDDVSRKKQKLTKVQKNASLDNLSTFQTQSEAVSECTTSEKSKDLEFTVPDASTSPVCTNIEMKVSEFHYNYSFVYLFLKARWQGWAEKYFVQLVAITSAESHNSA